MIQGIMEKILKKSRNLQTLGLIFDTLWACGLRQLFGGIELKG